jgi:hypothetical protein
MSAEIDYAQEGRLLLERVNLQLDGKPERYANTNPLYQHPSGGTLFVGNCTASTSRPILDSLNITRVVYCQEGGEGAKPFMADPNFCYLDFPIGTCTYPNPWQVGAVARQAPTRRRSRGLRASLSVC